MSTVLRRTLLRSASKMFLLALIVQFGALLFPSPASAGGDVSSRLFAMQSVDTENRYQIFAASEGTLGARPGETDFLPAWRWQNIELDQDDGGLLAAVKSMPNSFAMILFALANFLWLILLNISKLGLSADFITPAAPSINAGVSQLGQLVFFLGGVLLAVVFWKAAREVLKGGGVKPFVRVFVCIVWLIGILGIQRVSDEAAEAFDPQADRRISAEAQASYPGTLPWMLRTVTQSVDRTAAGVVNSFSLRDRVSQAAGGVNETANPADKLTCANYIRAIHDQYGKYRSADGKSTGNASLAGLSSLWESTLYRSWITAQFSTSTGTDLGARVMCHQAEAINDISPTEQAAIAALAYQGPFSGGNVYKVFGPYNKSEDRRRAVAAWANCQLINGSLSATPELRYSFDGNAGNHDRDCASSSAAFSTNKDGLDGQYLDVFGNSDEAFEVANRESDLSTARKWENAWFGGNSAERILNAFLALLVALGMLWSLGFIAIGLVLVQFTMVILLLFVPVMLALVAADVRTDKVVGLFKLLGTSTFTKAFFGLIIAIVIEIASVGQAIVNFIPAGGGLFGQILKGLMPLAALMIVRRLLSSFGMGDILRPMGAVQFATASAAVATRDATAKSFTSAVRDPLLRKSGAERMLTKADRYSPVVENWNKEGRKSRKESIEAEREAKREARAEEREARGDGAVDQIKDWANSRGWNMDRVDDAVNAGAKVAGAAGLAAVSAGGSLPLTSVIGGAVLAEKANAWGMVGRKKKSDVDLAGLPEVNFNKDRLVDPTTSQAQHREYKRRRARAEKSGAGAASVDQEIVDGALSSTLANRFGAEFDGFEDERHMLGAKAAYARQTGYDYDDVLVASNGLMLPKPTDRQLLTSDQLSDWVHWLPEEDAERKTDEDDETYVNRLFGLGVARGLVNEQGETLDILSMLGYDLRDSNDRARVEGFLRGELDDKMLSTKVFQSRSAASEKVMLSRMLDLSSGFSQSGTRDLSNLQALDAAVKSVQRNLSETVAKTPEFRGSIKSSAAQLTSAVVKLQYETDPKVRQNTEKELVELREQFRVSVDTLNKHLFDVAQDMVYQQVDLKLGTGELNGVVDVEKFIAESLAVYVNDIQELEKARDGVLLGKIGDAQLDGLIMAVAQKQREKAANIVVDANTAAASYLETVKRHEIDSDRIGKTVKKLNSTRAIVGAIGSSQFPEVKGTR
jgi:hypothetical protein